jgi:hypothetical protein
VEEFQANEKASEWVILIELVSQLGKVYVCDFFFLGEGEETRVKGKKDERNG